MDQNPASNNPIPIKKLPPLPSQGGSAEPHVRAEFPKRKFRALLIASLGSFLVYLFLPAVYQDTSLPSLASFVSHRIARGVPSVSWPSFGGGFGAGSTSTPDAGGEPAVTTSTPGGESSEPPEPYEPAFEPGIKVACGTRLTSDTVLAGDVSGCSGDGIIIAGPITLDCDSYAIRGKGDGLSQIGIVATNVHNAVIRNCVVEGFLEGVVIRGGSDNTLSETIISQNGNPSTAAGQGIRIDGGSERNLLVGNTISGNFGDGAQLGDAPKTTLRGNIFEDNGAENILLLNSTDLALEENTSSGAKENALYAKNVSRARFSGDIYKGSVFVGGNSADNTFFGILVDGGRIRISESYRNIFDSISVNGGGGTTCIQLTGSSANTVKNSSLDECLPDSVVAEGTNLAAAEPNVLLSVELPEGGRIVERQGGQVNEE